APPAHGVAVLGETRVDDAGFIGGAERAAHYLFISRRERQNRRPRSTQRIRLASSAVAPSAATSPRQFGWFWYTGWRAHSACTCARTRVRTFASLTLSRMSQIQPASSRTSASPK